MSHFHSLTISYITSNTPQSVVITFQVPDHLQFEYNFKAGQYVTLKHEMDGNSIRRAYSICSVPTLTHQFQIAIKKVPNGVFSTWATTHLKVGDRMDVSTPEGKFVLEPQSNPKNYALVATGSGITPILSILQTILEQEPQSTVSLFYGNVSQSETMFFEVLQQLNNTYASRFQWQQIYSQENASDNTIKRISIDTFATLNLFDAYYLCGKEEMVQTLTNYFKTLSIPSENIHYELFTTSSNTVTNVFSGNSEATILLDDETYHVAIAEGETILEAGLKQGIDMPYSCQGGVCSSCCAKVTNGAVSMKKNNALSEKDVQDGFILTCQAIPTTSTITLDFDI